MNSITPELENLIRKIVREETADIVIKRIELEEIKKVLGELVKAQKQAEGRLTRLENVVAELAEAQRRAEGRLTRLENVVAELAEAQRRAEGRLTRLENVVAELAEAQRRAEGRLTRLENVVAELAEAQRRTEETVKGLSETVEKLSETVSELTKSVGRLSDTIGFGLEDIARIMIPSWLEKHEKIYVDELISKIFTIGTEEVEINLYGEGVKNGESVIIIGECKSRIYESEVNKFAKSLKKIISKALPKDTKVYALMFGYFVHPKAEYTARKHNIKTIAPYMIK